MTNALPTDRLQHSCDLEISGHLFKETRCIISPDGRKYLVFTGKIGSKDVTIRLQDNEWKVDDKGLLHLKTDAETARQYVELLASA